jgi:hypothetical protein
LNYKVIYKVHTEKDFHKFTARYGNKYGTAIYWDKLDKAGFRGIEVNWLPDLHDKQWWYQSWDCSSGCVWHPDAVRKIKLLQAWETVWKAIPNPARPQSR